MKTKNNFRATWLMLLLAWAIRGCEEAPAQTPFQNFGSQGITSAGQAFSNTAPGSVTSKPAFSNAAPGAIFIPDFAASYWVTNITGVSRMAPFMAGAFNYSTGYSTNGMLVWTNLVGGNGATTNIYLVYNDHTWATNSFLYTYVIHGGVWTIETNLPDVSGVFLAYLATSNGIVNGPWALNTTPPWNGASPAVTVIPY